jgi:cytochrome b involved in lipid metabolism
MYSITYEEKSKQPVYGWSCLQMSTIREISVEEVATHNTAQSLWIIIANQVWDVTKFAKVSPKGPHARDQGQGILTTRGGLNTE